MWTTVALFTAMSLAPAQAGGLQLSNVRTTFGVLGADRPDVKLLPGDTFFVAFDIEGLTVDPKTGKVQYSMGMEVTNSKGKPEFKQDPSNQETHNHLGGSRVPAFAHVDIGLDQPPGEYLMAVTVSDTVKKTSKTLSQKFTVMPKDFGLVRLQVSNGRFPVPPIGVPGQSLMLSFAAIGFQRDAAKKQPVIGVELRILDESGKPTLAQPITGNVDKDVPDNLPAVPMDFMLILNRSGKFTVELKATDQLSKKTSTLKFPIVVYEQK